MKIESLTFQSIPEGLDGLVMSVLFLHWLHLVALGCAEHRLFLRDGRDLRALGPDFG